MEKDYQWLEIESVMERNESIDFSPIWRIKPTEKQDWVGIQVSDIREFRFDPATGKLEVKLSK